MTRVVQHWMAVAIRACRRWLLCWLAVWFGLCLSPMALAQQAGSGNTYIASGGRAAVFGLHTFLGGVVTDRSASYGTFGFASGSSWTGASASAMVDGYVTVYAGGSFVLPLGSGSSYLPLAIQGASAAVTAAYYAQSAGSAGGAAGSPFSTGSLGPGVVSVSTAEYWHVPGSSGTAKITLPWVAASNVATLTGSDLNKLTLVGWNAGAGRWELIASLVDASALSTASSTPSFSAGASTLSSGSITSQAAVSLSTYTAFALGTASPHVYWDGPNTSANSVVDGGTSTWDSTTTNWTLPGGNSNNRWAGSTSVAIFQGTAGTVTVSGTQSAGGLTFNTGTYALNGGTITLANSGSNPLTVGAGLSATVGSVLTGSNPVSKEGTGTLTLSGLNAYTGGTTVNGGTLKAGVNNALPGAKAVTVSSGATLDINGTTQTVGALASAGTLALGSNGQITLTGNSTVGAVTGTGKIIVASGATLTLTQSLINSGVAIELAGGTLQLGAGLTHNLGAFTVTALGSVLDFASAGNASATFSSVDVGSSATLSVTNWTTGADLFAATAVVGNPARHTVNLAPLNRITFTGYPASNTNWRLAQNEITPILPNPQVRVAVVSYYGTGSFVYSLGSLSSSAQALTTASSGVAVTSVTMTGSSGVAATLSQVAAPAGWPAAPVSASCVDNLGSTSGNGTGSLGTLSGATLTIPAANMVAGADLICTFTNTLNSGLTGKVFNDGGAPSAGSNTGIPNNGVPDGSEAGLAGMLVSLTNCASTTYASTSTDANGVYVLSIPPAQAGQTVCVVSNLPSGYVATGASVGSTATPDGSATTVGGVAYTYSRSSQRQSFTAPATGSMVLNFGQVPVSTLISSSNLVAAAGSIPVHSHRFTAGTGGSVSLSTLAGTPSPASVTGWNEIVYLDAACTGTYQPNATRLSPPTTPVTVTQGQVLCFVVREFVPSAALNGSTNTLPVQAQLSLSNANPALSLTYTVTDTTTVSSAAVLLQKQVRNLTSGGTNAPWSTGNNAKTGDVLEYQITFTNSSAAPVTDVVVQDGTTNWTTWYSATASNVPSGMSCTVNTPANPAPAAALPCSPDVTGVGKGNLTWTFSGALAPAASGSVTFKVAVD